MFIMSGSTMLNGQAKNLNARAVCVVLQLSASS